MQAGDKIRLYRSLFRGRDDVFARRWDKNGSYFPDYAFDWNEFNAHKASCGHLTGKITVGIYPILEDNTSYFLAVLARKEMAARRSRPGALWSCFLRRSRYNLHFIAIACSF